jgi:hypothetical protein
MHPFAYKICHPAYGKNIAAAIKRNAVLEGQTLAQLNLLRDRLKRRVVRLEGMASAQDG